MQMFRNEICNLLSVFVPMDSQQIMADLETPPSAEMGDFAFPCFKLAKEMRNSPAKIAAELAERLPASELFACIEARGPYINFFCNRQKLALVTVHAVLEQKEGYGNLKKDRNLLSL